MATTDRVTGLSEGVAVKAPVKAGTTANITLSGAQTIDGVSVTSGDRVLVKNQSSGADNGIYTASAGAWSRALDFDTSSDVTGGTRVLVLQGTTNALTDYILTNTGTITIGSTALTFSALATAAPTSTVSIADGTALAPSLRFVNDADTGLYRIGANQLGVTTNGALVETFNTRGLASKAYTSVASASTVDLGAQAGPNVTITGNTGITSFGSTAAPGDTFFVRFTGTPTITHSSTLRLQGAANYTCAADDRAIVKCTASGSYEVYLSTASGLPVVAPAETKMSGDMVQMVNSFTTAVATGTTTIPLDDTIPQNTEGDQYLSLAITPTNVSNKLRIDVVLNVAYSTTATVTGALFQDSTAGALACVAQAIDSGSFLRQMVFTHYMTAGTTSATTFKVRIGGSTAGTTTLNGSGGARRYGGVFTSSITITEIKA